MADKLLAVSIVFLTCHFIVNVVLSGIAGATEGIIFKHKIGQISENHTTQITPSGPTFMIWNIIYLWLLAGYLFVCSLLFRSSGPDVSAKRYCNPTIFSRTVCFALILNAVLMTSWLFIWDNQLMTSAAVVLSCIALTNWIALATLARNLWNNVVTLKTENPRDLLAYRILLLNGLGVYATWTTLASLISVAVALLYDGEVGEPAPSLIALSFLTIFLALWVPLELIFWDNYFRYMITPLFTVLWGLSGIYVKQGQHLDIIDEIVRHFTTCLIIGTCCLIVIRAVVVVYRHFKRPLYIGLTMASSA